MFRTIIRESPFIGEFPDAHFTNITGDSYLDDKSMLSTLRALVGPRLPQDGELSLRIFIQRGVSTEAIKDWSLPDLLLHLTNNNDAGVPADRFTLSVIGGSDESKAMILERLREELPKEYPDFTRMSMITEFFKNSGSIGMELFVNPSIRASFMVFDRMNYQVFHMLQALTPLILPWFFPEGIKSLDEEEVELINSLKTSGIEADRYLDALTRLASRYNFQEAYIRSALKDFESSYERYALAQQEENLARANNDINYMNEKIGSLLRDRRDILVTIAGLRSRIAECSGSSEIMEFFIRNPNLLLRSTSNGELTFVARGYLSHFNTEEAEDAIGNHYGCLYEHTGSIDENDAELLFRELFLNPEPRLRIRFCAAYQFRMSGHVSALSGYSYPAECSGFMPNPHIDQYGCLGNYSTAINVMLQDGDYVGALEQCLISAGNLNFTDYTVLDKFAKNLLNPNYEHNRCIELPDGTIVNASKAIRWLHE